MAKNQQMVQQETITKTLTDKEKLFAELAAENYYASDTKPNYQLAIEAGYAEGSARQRAYENLNPRIKPYVVLRIEELKEDFIIEELQRGYHLEGKVLRHALVKVSMGPGKQNSQQEVEKDTVEGDIDSEENTSEDV